MVALGLSTGSCSCEGESNQKLVPVFKLLVDGKDAEKDKDGSADWKIDYKTVTIGGRGVPEIQIHNAGSVPLKVRLDKGVPSPFAIDFKGETEVGVNVKRKTAITFEPREAGEYDEVLELQTNESSSQGDPVVRRIRLVGRSEQALFSCTPATLDLGMVVQGNDRTGTTICRNLLEVPITVNLQGLTGAASQFFRAVLTEGDGQTATVEAGESIAIDVTYTATVVGRFSATLPVRDENDQTLASVLVEAETVSGALQMDPSGCLNFGAVDVKGRVTRSLFIRNVSPREVLIESLGILGDNPNFSVVSPDTQDPVPVAAEGTEALEVVLAFHPQTAEHHDGALRIQSNDPLQPNLDVCLSGVGGGARISCTPATLDFGAVAIGTSVSRPYQCTNSAEAHDGMAAEPLYVESVSSDNPLFAGELRNQDGSREPKPEGYAPGESFFVDVTYTPGTETLNEGNIFVHSTATATPEFPTPVAGFGRILPPCQFLVRPPSLRFGIVGPGQQRTVAFYIQNDMENDACLVNGLRLSDDSDPAFSVEEIASAEIAPMERLAVPVTFAPTEEKRASGEVQFYVSNPDAPAPVKVALSGTGARPCLDIDPTDLDFGSVPPGCSTREQLISLINNCTDELVLQDLYIDHQAYPWFAVTGAPMMPLTIQPGNRIEFGVSYRPDTIGAHHGSIEVQLKDSDPYVVSLKGNSEPGATQTDVFSQKDVPKVDVLWVIDNSGSMSPYQNMIKQNLPAFLDFALEQNIDFHLGVTTSGLTTSGGCPGGANGGENGRLFPVDNSFPRILNSRMPWAQLESAWTNNVQVGICHGTEPMYEAAKRALSPPVINNTKVPGTSHPNDGNLGFLRPEASLSIIIVHDESDQDSAGYGSVQDFVDFYRSLKPSRRADTVKVHAISGGKVKGSCSASACPRCVAGPELTGGTWMDICTPPNNSQAWGAALEKMSQAAFGFDTAFTLRGQPADKNGDKRLDDQDIEVRVNGRVRPSRTATGATIWRYNHSNNSISFTPLYVPKPGQEISATYDILCG